ncbi:hypothetical protein [Paractinoplanes atraurantiacus]|uniref:Uncharacterized protein n=1 Tax=Paractinoplanes atraurantiacus TaxID=1036182 RepID=A0A285KNB2_9ACTN|nr:hypothetical protein [Actinoplanes atraurantiacus]SNY72866.1 hypothetical protein SAMN05421748_14436 [Actinoplanes atraurantiacus]
MADSTTPSSQESAAERLARALGVPAPEPLTGVQERAYREWMRRGDELADAVYTGRTPHAA